MLVLLLDATSAQGRRPRAPTWAPESTLGRRLLGAARSKDPTDLERVAAHLGVAGLWSALTSNEPERQKAAALAAPHLHENWYLVAALADLLHHADHSVAEAAAQATRRITEDLRRTLLARYEESPATLQPWASALLRAANDRQVPLAARTAALYSLAQLRAVMPIDESHLVRFLRAPTPALRSAAVEALVASSNLTSWAPLAQLIATDPSLDVARAAAAALCAELPAAGKERAIALAALHSTGAFARFRQLAKSRGATPDELVELAACLRSSRNPRDRRAYSRLRRNAAVRCALAHLRR